jgi:uncharacterized repeat protein (TIGR01451 family)
VTGSTTIVGGVLQTSEGDPEVVGDEVTVNVPTNPAPNTTYAGTVAGDSFQYIFNEQVVNPDGSLTVYAGHMRLLGPVAVGDIYWGASQCGVTAIPGGTTTSTTSGGTTTSTGGGTTTSTTLGGTTTSTTLGGTTTSTTLGGTTTSVIPSSTSMPTTTLAQANLRLQKACDAAATPGGPVNCSLTVTSSGPQTALNVTVTDTLPAGATLVGTPAGGAFTCVPGAPGFSCSKPAVGNATVQTITFTMQVGNSVPSGTVLTNTATVSSSTPDPNSGDNTATATTTVVLCTITGAGDIIGTEGNDVICGSAGPDRISGLGGDDLIFGMGGDDQLNGGAGNDTLIGGTGVDRLAGGPGDDRLITTDGVGGDYLAGGDHITGDTCIADAGDLKAQCEL